MEVDKDLTVCPSLHQEMRQKGRRFFAVGFHGSEGRSGNSRALGMGGGDSSSANRSFSIDPGSGKTVFFD